MTFDEIVADIAGRLNLTSATAIARIGGFVNERYRHISSSMGLQTIRRTTATASTVVGNRSLTFGPQPIPVEKIMSVFNPNVTQPSILTEAGFDELRNSAAGTDPPSRYAIQLMGAKSVTIFLGCTPATIYTLSADVESNQAILSGGMVPAFTESYHDILVYGGYASELDKMEKYTFAAKQEKKFEDRLSDYRLFIAKSAYKDIYQGKNKATRTVQMI